MYTLHRIRSDGIVLIAQDNMLGTMLDISDGVEEILDWIKKNGGWERNALYVTADHDHYLTLKDHFPETLANLIIAGRSHDITPNMTLASGWRQSACCSALPARAFSGHTEGLCRNLHCVL